MHLTSVAPNNLNLFGTEMSTRTIFNLFGTIGHFFRNKCWARDRFDYVFFWPKSDISRPIAKPLCVLLAKNGLKKMEDNSLGRKKMW